VVARPVNPRTGTVGTVRSEPKYFIFGESGEQDESKDVGSHEHVEDSLPVTVAGERARQEWTQRSSWS